VRTLRRDVERLRELGCPVGAQPGVDGGYRLAAGASLPPLVLDDDEAVALTVGLQTAGMAESSVRALTEVVPVLPARLRRRVDALRATSGGELLAGSALAGVSAGERPPPRW
jgi:predicted DNA-binding transcriptional regulator YafY